MLIANTYFLKILILCFLKVDKVIPTCRSTNISQNINKSCFTSSISTQQTKYLFLFDRKIYFVKSIKLTLFNFISLYKIFYLYHDIFQLCLLVIMMITLGYLIIEIKFLSKDILFLLSKYAILQFVLTRLE